MEQLKTYDWILKEAKKLKGADIYFKEEWGAYVMLIGGKMFGLLGINKENESILSLKGKPEDNELARDMYSYVTQGYYLNKVHWISIKLEAEDLDRQWLIKLLNNSYSLVYNKLPKKVRVLIEE